MKEKIATTAFLLLLLLVTFGAEAKLCQAPSKSYKGTCDDESLNNECAIVCFSEGYTSGFCMVEYHQCICTKECDSSGVKGGGDSDGEGGGIVGDGGGDGGGTALLPPDRVGIEGSERRSGKEHAHESDNGGTACGCRKDEK
ncbi:hypothetical protein ACP4OV_009773 [Aristida adscensionis]